MENMIQPTSIRERFSDELNIIRGLPEFQRIPAENRFLLIKEFEEFSKREAKKLGRKFRRVQALKDFCEYNGTNCKTLYRHMKLERKGGIKALIQKYGKAGGKSYADRFLPLIQKIHQPGHSYKNTYERLVSDCKLEGIKVPSYNTVRRIIILSGLSKSKIDTEKKAQALPGDTVNVQEQPTTLKIPKRFKINTPQWLKVSNKKDFNLALYKYSLILPLLNPDLFSAERNRLIDDITDRTHYPPMGGVLNISRSSVLRYISIVKDKGFEGLMHKQHLCYERRYKNVIWATFRIDMNDPLAVLKQLIEIIKEGPNTSPHAKEVSLRFLDQCVANFDTWTPIYKQVWLERPLTAEEIQTLKGWQRRGKKKERIRAVAILMASEHYTFPEILNATGCSKASIYRWLKKFKEEGINFIKTKVDVAKNNPELMERKGRVIQILHRKPGDYDINSTTWRLKDIANVYEKEYGKKLSISSIRRSIRQTGYSIKRAVRVLSSPDPEYLEKTKKVLETLRSLKPNEAFFFIDEAGPWQVKKYGGRSLSPKGIKKTYPQFQKPKGRVTFIGALDAIKNQVIFFFTKSKTTASVLCLIKILFFKYRDYSTLFLTWDCASWHNAKELQAFLKNINKFNKGPKIEVVPLPKRSQYLNVIESVFSGLKKAVILNSDYDSENEMKSAISRHFQERNEDFKDHPKRVGKKIWDNEYYDLDKLDAGLFKRI